nr:hypothetical protein Iba_chr02aCG8760 [Ipomoea batatas]
MLILDQRGLEIGKRCDLNLEEKRQLANQMDIKQMLILDLRQLEIGKRCNLKLVERRQLVNQTDIIGSGDKLV